MKPLVLFAMGLSLVAAADGVKLGLTNESSLGVTLNGGNSEAQSFLVKESLEYTWERDVVRVSGHYLYGRASGVESAKNWDIAFRYEHFISPTLGTFVGNTYEGDTFAGYDYRVNLDVG